MRETQSFRLVTFQRDPVVLPLASRGGLHLLVLLMDQEVLDSQRSRLPDRAVGAANRKIRRVGGTQSAAASLVTHGRARLLPEAPPPMGLQNKNVGIRWRDMLKC